MRYRGDFIFLYMYHLTKEAELIIKNLILFLKYKYGNEVLYYFTEKAKLDTTKDEWGSELKYINYKSDRYLEEEFKDEIGLDEAKLYVEEQKKGMKTKEEARPCLDLKQNSE